MPFHFFQKWSRFHSIITLFILICISGFVTYYQTTLWESHFDLSSKEIFINSISLKYLNCEGILKGNKRSIRMHEHWQFDPVPVEDGILKSESSCNLIKKEFEFRDKPLSKEEEDYPLAYGLVVYKEVVQVLFMISAFYHPQNEYCISVSGSADESFKIIMRKLGSCFPNIHIMDRPPIEWGSFEIINSTYACLEYLSNLKSDWKYYQYLSGVDVPLRTNLEMVKIFKVLNGTPNVHYRPYPKERLIGANESDSPLPLFKSSLSTLIPRATADYIVQSNVTQELLEFLNDTEVPDESFWGTLTGNVKIFPIPGGIDGQEFVDLPDDSKMKKYYARHQEWDTRYCKGKITSKSCVFGVKDLAHVMEQQCLVAHKFYLDFQPAAFFCALQEVRRRSLNPVPFNASNYRMN